MSELVSALSGFEQGKDTVSALAASATAQAAEGAACVRSSRRGRTTSALMARGKAMTWIGSDLSQAVSAPGVRL